MANARRKIYSRRGDRGQTRLLSGEMVTKDDARVQTYGAVDELQAHIGMTRALTRHESVQAILRAIQEDIIVAGAELASSPEATLQLKRRVDKAHVVRLESWIDKLTALYNLPNRFVRPGASAGSAAAHLARVVCRRCERLIVMLNRQVGGYDDLMVYFNRLSDLLFVIAWCLEVHVIVEDMVLELASRTSEKGGGR